MPTIDRLRKTCVSSILTNLKTNKPELWPELNEFDYISRYQMGKEAYFKLPRQVYEIRPVERLFEYIAMKGGDREEAIRVLIFMEVVIDAEKEYLDVKTARKELGIEELIEKYMREGAV